MAEAHFLAGGKVQSVSSTAFPIRRHVHGQFHLNLRRDFFCVLAHDDDESCVLPTLAKPAWLKYSYWRCDAC